MKKINHNELREICLAPMKDFYHLGKVNAFTVPGYPKIHWEKQENNSWIQVSDGRCADRKERYIFIDNGASVLAVAHLDCVQQTDHYFVKQVGGKYFIFNGQLDDRLGAYIIIKHLPKILGEGRYDVLLTEGEEHGSSTSMHFKKDKQYNWMFMFDRAGTDCVSYEYSCAEWDKFIKSYGWATPFGSYSCIRELEHLECKGLNVGTGYYDNHGLLSHAIVDDVQLGIERFCKFFTENEKTVFKHTHKEIGFYAPPGFYCTPQPVHYLAAPKTKDNGVCPRCGLAVTEKDLLKFLRTDGSTITKCVWCVDSTDEEINQDYIPGQPFNWSEQYYFD